MSPFGVLNSVVCKVDFRPAESHGEIKYPIGF